MTAFLKRLALPLFFMSAIVLAMFGLVFQAAALAILGVTFDIRQSRSGDTRPITSQSVLQELACRPLVIAVVLFFVVFFTGNVSAAPLVLIAGILIKATMILTKAWPRIRPAWLPTLVLPKGGAFPRALAILACVGGLIEALVVAQLNFHGLTPRQMPLGFGVTLGPMADCYPVVALLTFPVNLFAVWRSLANFNYRQAAAVLLGLPVARGLVLYWLGASLGFGRSAHGMIDVSVFSGANDFEHREALSNWAGGLTLLWLWLGACVAKDVLTFIGIVPAPPFRTSEGVNWRRISGVVARLSVAGIAAIVAWLRPEEMEHWLMSVRPAPLFGIERTEILMIVIVGFAVAAVVTAGLPYLRRMTFGDVVLRPLAGVPVALAIGWAVHLIGGFSATEDYGGWWLLIILALLPQVLVGILALAGGVYVLFRPRSWGGGAPSRPRQPALRVATGVRRGNRDI